MVQPQLELSAGGSITLGRVVNLKATRLRRLSGAGQDALQEQKPQGDGRRPTTLLGIGLLCRSWSGCFTGAVLSSLTSATFDLCTTICCPLHPQTMTKCPAAPHARRSQSVESSVCQ
jgi:hypothetical protein